MITGTGSIILGSSGFNTDFIPLCNNTFSLSERYTTYGYKYLNSSKKLLNPSIESYDAKDKTWTIQLSLGDLDTNDYLYLINSNSDTLTVPVSYEKFSSRANDLTAIELSATDTLSIYNHTTNSYVTQVTTAPAIGEFRLIDSRLEFNLTNLNDTVTVSGLATNATVQETMVGNRVMSFSGIVHIFEQSYALHCTQVQISKYPELKVGTMTLSLKVIGAPQLFKI